MEDDDQVLVERRTRSIAENMQERLQLVMPEQLAIEVIGDDAGRGEVGVHRLAIRHRRAGAMRIVGMRGFLGGARHLSLPELLAVRPVKAQHRPPHALVERLREKDAIAPDNRC